MQYKTILKNERIDGEVNALIKDGYKPKGGISIVSIKDKLWMSQAMVRTAPKKAGKRFKPPELQEVKDYIAEKKYRVDANAWFAHYEKVGWKAGKTKMVDWKAGVRTWQFNSSSEK